MPNMKDCEIAVIGGGISGVVLSLSLLHHGFTKFQIYEHAHNFSEIGAGIGMTPNAVRAMPVAAPGVYEAYMKVATHNINKTKQDVFFEFQDGWNKDKPVGHEDVLFALKNEKGANAVHRAHFLEELVKGIPREQIPVHFKKHVETIVYPDSEDEKITIKFGDGSTATCDVLIGCDGVKSKTRRWMYGDASLHTPCYYTHKYAWRGLIPMKRAVEALGEENALSAKMHLGQDAHVLTFPVDGGVTMNVVAFVTSEEPWPSTEHLTLHDHKERVFKDFAEHGPTVKKIMEMLEPNLDCWAIFDLGEFPLPHYNKGRVCLLGDSAHATSPHHGSGAGFCIEDVAVMGELLADESIQELGTRGFEAAFQVFNDVRIERTQWLVQSSRFSGELYQWRAPHYGRDIEKIQKEVSLRSHKIWDAQIDEMVLEAKKSLKKMVQSQSQTTAGAAAS